MLSQVALNLLCGVTCVLLKDNAVFGVYCRRWGVPLIDAGTVCLLRIVGHIVAMDMILTGRPVNADEALTFGLVNRVVGTGKSRNEAERIAEEIAAFPQECMKADRKSAINQWSLPLDGALEMEGRAAHSILEREAFSGAQRFASGRGRGGRFDDYTDKAD